jgi:hypothetical protein
MPVLHIEARGYAGVAVEKLGELRLVGDAYFACYAGKIEV